MGGNCGRNIWFVTPLDTIYEKRERCTRQEIVIRFTNYPLTSIGCFVVNYAIISYTLSSNFPSYFYEICYFNVFNNISYIHYRSYFDPVYRINKIIVKNWQYETKLFFLFNLKNGSRFNRSNHTFFVLVSFETLIGR